MKMSGSAYGGHCCTIIVAEGCVCCVVIGIVGMLLRYVTPLTIVPTVSLVGLSLFENAAEAASQHWGIAVG
jgi:xanthine/uracil permease